VPRQNCLVAYEVDLAVGETLASVDIGATGLDILSANLLANSGYGKSQKPNAKEFI
jgi:hypothetical protein